MDTVHQSLDSISKRSLAIDSEIETQRKARKSLIIYVTTCVLILLFAVGSMTVIVLGLEPASASKQTVDVVIYQGPDSIRGQRSVLQAQCVRKFLPFVKKIFILNTQNNNDFDSTLNIQFVALKSTTDTLIDAFAFQKQLNQTSDTLMFLGDQTFPLREMKSSYLFMNDYSRLFNVFREEAEIRVLEPYYELPTMPTAFIPFDLFQQSGDASWQHITFRLVTEEQAVLFNSVNRDILLDGKDTANIQQQFKLLSDATPFFATFHVNPMQNPDSVRVQTNILINSFVSNFLS